MIKDILEILNSRFKEAGIDFVMLEAEFNPTWSFWAKGKEIPEARFTKQEITSWRGMYSEAEIKDMVVEQVSGSFKRMENT